MDVVVFKKDDCWLNFNECFLNISKVVTDKSFFVTPYSVEGFRVTCFNPLEELPSNVRELYIGENITSLGEGVIGLKDKRLGEIAAAIIEVKPDMTLTEEELEDFCYDLPRYKRPRKVIFADVPRNPTGKIEKPKLREMYGANRLIAEQNLA